MGKLGKNRKFGQRLRERRRRRRKKEEERPVLELSLRELKKAVKLRRSRLIRSIYKNQNE